MEPTVSGDVTTDSSNGKESSHLNEIYLMSAILACLAVIGTAGNAIVICVFNRKRDKSVPAFFILILALLDFTTCLFIIPFIIIMINVHFKIRYDFICKTGIFLDIANILFSAFVMVAIAIDRYFAICHPFKRVMTVPRAKLIVICMAVIASAIGVCFSLTVGVYNSATVYLATNKDRETFGSMEDRKESTTGIYQSAIDVNSSGVDVFLKQSTAGFNPLSNSTETSHAKLRYTIVYTGYCYINELILSMESLMMFYYFHSALYLFCFVVVLVLYILIYRYVLLQQKIRRQLKMETHLSLVRSAHTSVTANCHSNRIWRVKLSLASCAPTTRSPSPDDDELGSPSRIPHPRQVAEGSNPYPAASAAERASNLKTAAMLFVVTIVFALSYFPAFLMQYNLIPSNLTAFYMHFVNNVANPIVYSFMNRNFREKVKNLMSRR